MINNYLYCVLQIVALAAKTDRKIATETTTGPGISHYLTTGVETTGLGPSTPVTDDIAAAAAIDTAPVSACSVTLMYVLLPGITLFDNVYLVVAITI